MRGGVSRAEIAVKELAVVLKTAGKIATVQIEKRPECDACKMCAFKDGKSRVKVRALNAAGAKAGDTVLVKAEKDNRLLASFIVYIVPVLLAGAGLLIGFFCFKEELYIALLCLAGLVLGLACVFFCDRILANTRGFGMEVIEIIDTEKDRGELPPDGADIAGKNIQEEDSDGTDV